VTDEGTNRDYRKAVTFMEARNTDVFQEKSLWAQFRERVFGRVPIFVCFGETQHLGDKVMK
jgi:hypothetical protein